MQYPRCLLTGVLSCTLSVCATTISAGTEPHLFDSVATNLPPSPVEGHGTIEVIYFSEGNKDFAKITFEGAGNSNAIPQIDVGFTKVSSPGWLSLVDADAGGSGNFANEPSPSTIAFWLDLPAGSRDLPRTRPVHFLEDPALERPRKRPPPRRPNNFDAVRNRSLNRSSCHQTTLPLALSDSSKSCLTFIGTDGSSSK